jgi:hypothetical protein
MSSKTLWHEFVVQQEALAGLLPAAVDAGAVFFGVGGEVSGSTRPGLLGGLRGSSLCISSVIRMPGTRMNAGGLGVKVLLVVILSHAWCEAGSVGN